MQTTERVHLPRPVGDVGDNPLRTPDNQRDIIIDFAIGRSWRQVAAKFKCDKEAIRKWMLADDNFKSQYLQAKDFATDFLSEKISEALESLDVIETYPDTLPSGEPHPKAGDPLPTERDKAQRVRAKVDGYKILMEKLAPKKYGNLLKIADSDGNNLNINIMQFEPVLPPVIDHDAEEVLVDGDHPNTE